MSPDSMLLRLLAMVATAPPTQLRPDYTTRAQAMGHDPATTAAAIHAFFAEVYALTDLDASSFVRQLVNPAFTKDYA